MSTITFTKIEPPAWLRGQGDVRQGAPARPVTKPSQRHEEVHRPMQPASSSRASVSLRQDYADSVQRIESVIILVYAIPLFIPQYIHRL
jgi:hypothetical protein